LQSSSRVDSEGRAVAQLARDHHCGGRLALLGGEDDPEHTRLPVHREAVGAEVEVQAQQILRVAFVRDGALDQLHHRLGDGAGDLEFALPSEAVDPGLDAVRPERIDCRGRR
jgi:hypothetical protein